MRGKVVNDPVYGFIHIPYGLVYDLLQHPYMQRLRRITQLGLSSYVYPGAVHTRFHHALGALHLMQQAISTLQSKGVEISETEAEAACCAILLHDVGHGPFSHALEHTLLPVHHETLTLHFMESLNEAMQGRLDVCIAIFEGKYPKHFLHQLVSGQLDMDRMDYLMRDSFFTGVIEGMVGYDRIIKMLDVREGRLVVEEKGIYSIERFLHARRLMYWQVYLHKTVLSAEHMLIRTLGLAKSLATTGYDLRVSEALGFFLYATEDRASPIQEILHRFSQLDDTDIMQAIKVWSTDAHPLLRFMASSILNRRLFALELGNEPAADTKVDQLRKQISASIGSAHSNWLDTLVFQGEETIRLYNTDNDEILVLRKSGVVVPLSQIEEISLNTQIVKKTLSVLCKTFVPLTRIFIPRIFIFKLKFQAHHEAFFPYP